MPQKDAELVGRCLRGDRDAFGALIRRYQDAVYGLALTYVRDFADAEDLAQEAFVSAYLNLSTLRDPSKFGPWLKSTVVHLCHNWRRSRTTQMVRLDEVREEVLSHASRPDELQETKDLRESVLDAIGRLSEKNRQAVTLYYIDGLSTKEIGAFLDVSPAAVDQRLHRAREQLKEEMAMMIVSRTIEAEHTPQNLPPDTEPSYVIAHERIVQWMDRARFTARSGECVRVVVGENEAGVDAVQMVPTVGEEGVHFHFDALDEEGRVVTAWDIDNVKPGVGMRSGDHSGAKPEYYIKVQVNPEVSDAGEVTVDFAALLTIPPTREEMDQWFAHSGKQGHLIMDMQTMAHSIEDSIRLYRLSYDTLPESLGDIEVELLPDVYGKEGDRYRCELHGEKGFVLYSCGEDGQYETDDDEVWVLTKNGMHSGKRWELRSSGGRWLPFEGK